MFHRLCRNAEGNRHGGKLKFYYNYLNEIVFLFSIKNMQTSLQHAKYADLQICKHKTHGTLNTYIFYLLS